MTQENRAWISMKERVPTTKDYVLIYDPDFDAQIVAMWNAERLCWDDGDYRDHMTGISHWMPLPEPPQKERER